MRQGTFYLLLAVLCAAPALHAEESQLPALGVSTPADSAEQIAALQRELTESQRLLVEAQAASGERETAQIGRLRQDNQRLKLQLKQAQAEQPPRLLSEQQLWFAIGAGTALVAFIVGRLSAAGRGRRRSEWA
jgi:hypothetical protein